MKKHLEKSGLVCVCVIHYRYERAYFEILKLLLNYFDLSKYSFVFDDFPSKTLVWELVNNHSIYKHCSAFPTDCSTRGSPGIFVSSFTLRSVTRVYYSELVNCYTISVRPSQNAIRIWTKIFLSHLCFIAADIIVFHCASIFERIELLKRFCYR